MSTHAELRGDILVVTLDNPPVNSLGFELRSAVLAALDRAQAEPQVRAVLLIGANGVFCGGADIRQLNTPQYWAYPRTIELATVLDGMSKPVVAAIGGLAMGGGLELALGCHYRVAAADVRLALPEVKLGLLPGGGGTIRLPRLVGVEHATEMMLGGEPVGGQRALEIGLVDALVEDELEAGALRFTRGLIGAAAPPRRARDLPVRLADPAAWFAGRRRALQDSGPPGPAARTILQCIEAGVTLPFEEAVKVSDAGTAALMTSPESKALRYLFFAEREAGKIGAATPSQRRPIERVALIGRGGPAAALQDLLQGAGVAITETACDLLVATSLAASDQQRLRELHASLPPQVPFATTGPFADWQALRALAAGRTVLGLRFAGDTRAVELVREPQADPVALDAVARLMRRLGKLCVPCAPAPGFILERLQPALSEEALAAEGQHLLDEGVAVRSSDIDVALVASGRFPATRGGPMFCAAQALPAGDAPAPDRH